MNVTEPRARYTGRAIEVRTGHVWRTVGYIDPPDAAGAIAAILAAITEAVERDRLTRGDANATAAPTPHLVPITSTRSEWCDCAGMSYPAHARHAAELARPNLTTTTKG